MIASCQFLFPEVSCSRLALILQSSVAQVQLESIVSLDRADNMQQRVGSAVLLKTFGGSCGACCHIPKVRYRKQARLCCSDASINKALAVVYVGAQHDSHTRARRRLPKGSSYTVSPSRFDSADVESEKNSPQTHIAYARLCILCKNTCR